PLALCRRAGRPPRAGQELERGAAGPRRGYANRFTSDSPSGRPLHSPPGRPRPVGGFFRPANSPTQATLSSVKTLTTVKKLLTPTPSLIEIATRLESRLAGRARHGPSWARGQAATGTRACLGCLKASAGQNAGPRILLAPGRGGEF